MSDDEHSWKEDTARFWDDAADRWSRIDIAPSARVAELMTALSVEPGDTLLDAGCGAGRWSLGLARDGYKVRGMDIAPEMVAHASRKAAQLGLSDHCVSFQVGDIERLPFANDSFDGALCFNVLDFVPSPGVALMELWRVLKPGRSMVLMTLGAYSPVRRDHWRRFLPGSGSSYRANHILPWEMEALLRGLGWQVHAGHPFFGPSTAGNSNPYDERDAEKITDTILLQTIASSWRFLVKKPATDSSKVAHETL